MGLLDMFTKKNDISLEQGYQLAVEHAKNLGMDIVKRWIYKRGILTFVCGHSVPQQSGHPYFVIIKNGKAIHPKPYQNDEIWFNGHLASEDEQY